MRIEPAEAADVEPLADAWVALAAEQRDHDSHLLPAENRPRIRESLAHHVVEDTCLIARQTDEDAGGDIEDEDAGDAIEDEEPSDNEREPSDVDPSLLGFVTFTPDADNYEMNVDRGTIENLWVRPRMRGRGIGARLLDAAEQALTDHNVDVAALEVLARNERAREFYDREGYDDHRFVLEKRLDVETDTKGNHRD